jgi:hypothetical protein
MAGFRVGRGAVTTIPDTCDLNHFCWAAFGVTISDKSGFRKSALETPVYRRTTPLVCKYRMGCEERFHGTHG